MEKCCKNCIMGCFHLYECVWVVWLLFGPVCKRFNHQNSREMDNGADGELRTESKFRSMRRQVPTAEQACFPFSLSRLADVKRGICNKDNLTFYLIIYKEGICTTCFTTAHNKIPETYWATNWYQSRPHPETDGGLSTHTKMSRHESTLATRTDQWCKEQHSMNIASTQTRITRNTHTHTHLGVLDSEDNGHCQGPMGSRHHLESGPSLHSSTSQESGPTRLNVNTLLFHCINWMYTMFRGSLLLVPYELNEGVRACFAKYLCLIINCLTINWITRSNVLTWSPSQITNHQHLS